VRGVGGAVHGGAAYWRARSSAARTERTSSPG
jgi:hypothetical protein